MALDLWGSLDAAMARGLRSFDVAYQIAENLQAVDPSSCDGQSIQRALKIRKALAGAGIEFPPFRRMRDPEAPPLDLDRIQWTVTQIAEALGVHRTSVIRYVRRLGGKIEQKYQAATQQGVTVMFERAEAHAIMASAWGGPGTDE
jgi:hypothetical protein